MHYSKVYNQNFFRGEEAGMVYGVAGGNSERGLE